MDHTIDDIDDLIGKVLAGEGSPEERQRVEEWSRLSEENAAYLAQLKIIFDKAASKQVQMKFDADAAWQKVKDRIKKTDPKIKQLTPAPSPVWTVARIAAGLALILSAGILVYTWNSQPTQTFALRSGSVVAQDTLPDGSTAFLNKKSSITYEYNPRKKTRKVKLNGESFFEVKHEEEKPFIIEADEVIVRDIGTSFNVKAWPESDTVEVLVKSGEVQIYTANNAGLSLKAGETGMYSKRLKEFSRLQGTDANALAYQTRVFSFNNTDLKTVINKINEVYDAHIKIENPAVASCRLTVNFHSDSLDTIVEVIAETLKLTVTRKNKEILLSGPGCSQE